jgi:hypothetical protein
MIFWLYILPLFDYISGLNCIILTIIPSIVVGFITRDFLIFDTSVKLFDRRPPQRRQRRASDSPATPATVATSLSIL